MYISPAVQYWLSRHLDPYQLCVSSFQSDWSPLGKGFAGYKCVEALISHFENTHPKIHRVVNKIRMLPLVIDLGMMCWTAGKLLHTLDQNYKISKIIIPLKGWRYGLFATASVGLMIGYAIFVTSLVIRLNKRFGVGKPIEISYEKNKIEDSSLKNKTIIRGRPLIHQFQQGLWITQMILNTALAVFSKAPYFYAINAIAQGYSLYKISQQKWLECQVTYQNVRSFPKIDISYFIPLISNGDDSQNYFCTKHFFSIDEIFDRINSTLDPTTLINNSKYKRNSLGITRYVATIAQQDLPTCPTCNQEPISQSIHATVYKNSTYGDSPCGTWTHIKTGDGWKEWFLDFFKNLGI